MPMIRIIDDFELNIKFLLVGFGYAYVDMGVFFLVQITCSQSCANRMLGFPQRTVNESH